MPFGLTHGPGTLQRLMNLALKGLTWKDCLVYLDDIVAWSKTFDEHMNRLRGVMERLKAAKVKLKSKKCAFLQRTVIFLGHVVSANGIQSDPEKIRAVKAWPLPENISEPRGFLGAASYYRRFVPGFATKAEPLCRPLQKEASFEWKAEQDDAFQKLKECLTSPPVLIYPVYTGY